MVGSISGLKYMLDIEDIEDSEIHLGHVVEALQLNEESEGCCSLKITSMAISHLYCMARLFPRTGPRARITEDTHDDSVHLLNSRVKDGAGSCNQRASLRCR